MVAEDTRQYEAAWPVDKPCPRSFLTRDLPNGVAIQGLWQNGPFLDLGIGQAICVPPSTSFRSLDAFEDGGMTDLRWTPACVRKGTVLGCEFLDECPNPVGSRVGGRHAPPECGIIRIDAPAALRAQRRDHAKQTSVGIWEARALVAMGQCWEWCFPTSACRRIPSTDSLRVGAQRGRSDARRTQQEILARHRSRP